MSTFLARQQIGNMDQRIKIKRKVLTDDGFGGRTETQTEVLSAWADVDANSGRESQRFERLHAEATYLFTIRKRKDVEVRDADIIEWQGVDYNIRFRADLGTRQMYLQMTAERGVAQ